MIVSDTDGVNSDNTESPRARGAAESAGVAGAHLSDTPRRSKERALGFARASGAPLAWRCSVGSRPSLHSRSSTSSTAALDGAQICTESRNQRRILGQTGTLAKQAPRQDALIKMIRTQHLKALEAIFLPTEQRKSTNTQTAYPTVFARTP